MTTTIYTNNTVSLDGRYVGRIHRDDANPRHFGDKRPVRFYTASGDLMKTGYDVEHIIDEPLYVGGPSDWTINPAFEVAIQKIVA